MSKKENILLSKRLQESLELSQGLANMEEMESMPWQKIDSEDPQRGGSLRVELKSPVFREGKGCHHNSFDPYVWTAERY